MADSDTRTDRRTVLAGLGGAVAVALAGCTTDTDGGDGGGGGGGDGGGGDGGSSEFDRDAVDEYLSDVGNYDGTVEDATGTGNVEVAVGAEGNGGNFAFDPPAVVVDSGTDVNWAWTGMGAQHNVVHEEGDFESELVEGEGNDFQHTFEDTGVYRYYCTPHQGVGMKGVVVVV